MPTNDIEKFLANVDAIVRRINPPSLFLDDDNPDNRELIELYKHKLAICFPNLSRSARNIILMQYILGRQIAVSTAAIERDPDSVENKKLAGTLAKLRKSLDHVQRKWDDLDLRAQLSDFQEEIMDYLMKIHTEKRL